MANSPLSPIPKSDPSLSTCGGLVSMKRSLSTVFYYSIRRPEPHAFPSCFPFDIFREPTHLMAISTIRPLRFYPSLRFGVPPPFCPSPVSNRKSFRTSPRPSNRRLGRPTPVCGRFPLLRTVVPIRRSHSSIRSPARSRTRVSRVRFCPSSISSFDETRFRPPVAAKTF